MVGSLWLLGARIVSCALENEKENAWFGFVHGVDRKARLEFLEGTLWSLGKSMNRNPTGSATNMESAFARRSRETLAVALFQPPHSLPLQPPSRQRSPLSDAEIPLAGW